MSPLKRGQRPLGSVRNSLTEATMPKMPLIQNMTSLSMDNGLEGVSGNALSTGADREGQMSKVNTGGQSSTRSNVTQRSEKQSEAQDKKEIRESQAREKSLKKDISSLKKTILELQSTICEKEENNKKLQEKIDNPIPDYKVLYDKEKEDHKETKTLLHAVENSLSEKIIETEKLEERLNQEIDDLKLKMEKELSDLRRDKDAVIADKDNRLKRLKGQMAETLKGNSWERQQQLDELSKELNRAQEEIEMLRTKLRNMNKNKNVSCCSNCDSLQSKLSKELKVSAEKDAMIEQLKSMCGRFDRQLKHQAEINKLTATTPTINQNAGLPRGAKMTTVHK